MEEARREFLEDWIGAVMYKCGEKHKSWGVSGCGRGYQHLVEYLLKFLPYIFEKEGRQYQSKVGKQT